MAMARSRQFPTGNRALIANNRRSHHTSYVFVRHPSVISPLTCEVALLVASDLLGAPTNEHLQEEDTPIISHTEF
eukprot:scaffold36526_cov139-Skeletonema_dohrnii-CCMP3373.AAC.5